MGYYINCLKRSGSLQKDIKELIPDMNLRRRMSRVVKTGVATGVESLIEFDEYGSVDAIVTATGLGCISDSEKFLANMILSEEQMLNPTLFIQSTFNTVSAQIALLRSLHCYNNTFTHRYTSFESAVADAMLQLDIHGAKAVLVGVFDEATPAVETIMRRMGLLKGKMLGEGAIFFVLTTVKLKCSVAEIVSLSFDAEAKEPTVSVNETNGSCWCGCIAETIGNLIFDGKYKEFDAINDVDGIKKSVIRVRCL